MLSEMGINVIETGRGRGGRGDRGRAGERGEIAEPAPTAVAAKPAREPTDRTDDPVRMYLREMGSVELLSREGEIAIAKRIEAGRETMIAGPLREPADLPGHHHLARRARRGQDSAARHHRPRGDLCRAGRQERVPPPPPEGQAGAPERRRTATPSPARRRPAGAAASAASPPLDADGEEIDEVEAERARIAGRGGGGRRVRERPVARRDGGRAQAEGGRDLRPASPTSTRSSAACRTRTSSSS